MNDMANESRIIKLSESELNYLIKESVKKVLQESNLQEMDFGGYMKKMFKKDRQEEKQPELLTRAIEQAKNLARELKLWQNCEGGRNTRVELKQVIERIAIAQNKDYYAVYNEIMKMI